MPPKPQIPPQDRSYIIESTRDGVLEPKYSPRAHLTELVGRAIESQKPVVVHLHGGLVNQGSAYGMVNHLQPIYLAGGFFPIFIVWRTGLFDAVKNGPEIVNRPLFKRLLIRLLKHFVGKYGAPGGKSFAPGAEPDEAQIEEQLAKRQIGEIPYEYVTPQPKTATMSKKEETELAAAVAGDTKLRREWEKEVSPPKGGGAKGLSIDQDVREAAKRELKKKPGEKAIVSAVLLAGHAVAIGARLIRRFFKHRDHGLHTTIVEEILRELYVDQIGTEVWQFMKQDSADTFGNAGKKPERAGWLLMQLLGEEVKRRKDADDPKPLNLSIVGHSAGCIYAVNLLSYLYEGRRTATSPWSQTGFQVQKLAFLAPAVTCSTLASMLDKHDEAPLFRAFRMFSLTDADEKSYYEVPVLYPGSLLYIISGLLESEDDDASADMPLTGMQRFARDANPFEEPEVVSVWKFLRSKPKQLVWSGDNKGPGLNCDSKRHGEFDSSPKTVESVVEFLKQP